MADRTATNRKTLPLVAACLAVAVLLVLLASIERSGGEFACAPVLPVPEDAPPAHIDPVPSVTTQDLAPSVTPPPAPTLAPRSEEGVFRGRVVDSALHQPVPSVDLIVTRGATAERITTDCAGRFVTTSLFAFGRVSLELVDGPRTMNAKSVEHDARGLEHEVVAPVAPTVWVDSIDGGSPDPTEGWTARLVDDATPPGVAGILRVGKGGEVDVRDGRSPVVGEWTGLRSCGGRWFVRDAAIAPRVSGRSIRRVQVRSEKLRRRGQAVVEILEVGSFARAIVTHAFTIVRGRLAVEGEVRPVHALVFRSNPPPEEVPEVLEFDVAASPDQETEYRFELDGQGQHELVLWRADATVERRTFLVDGRDVDLEPAIVRSSLRGRENVSVHRLGFRGDVRFDDGIHVLRLALPGFPRGVPRWVVPVEHGDVLASILPRAAFDVEDIGVQCLPRFLGPLRGVSFDADDAVGPAPSALVLRRASIEPTAVGGVPAGSLAYTTGPCAPFVWTSSPGDSSSWPTLAGMPNSVTVSAPGMRTRHVAPEEFLPIGDRDVASIRLEPGWGVELHVRTRVVPDESRSRSSPWWSSERWSWGRDLLTVFSRGVLPGARARVAGQTVGVSDDDGRLVVALERAPREIEIVADGWRVASVTTSGGHGEFRIVWMEREP